MKRFLFCLGVIFLLSSTSVFAQPMAGTYTINNSPAATGQDFNSLKAAIDALTLRGVSAAVTFNIASGVYLEQVTIPNIFTANSESKRITFQSASGNPADVLINKPPDTVNTNLPVQNWPEDLLFRAMNNHHVIRLDGSRYITIKGITLSNSAVFASCLHLCNQTEYIVIDNCVLNINNNEVSGGAAASSTESGAILCANKNQASATNPTIINPGNNARYLTVTNNVINGGQWGMYNDAYGSSTSNNKINDNIFNAAEGYAIGLGSSSNSEILRNHIDLVVDDGVGTVGIAINMASCNGVLIEGNYMKGSLLNGVRTLLCSNISIFNNMIVKSGISPRSVDASDIYGPGFVWVHSGIFINGGSNYYIYHNSIVQKNVAKPPHQVTSDDDVTPYNIYVLSGSNVRLLNNNLANFGEGIPITFEHSYQVSQSNYNNIYTNGKFVAKVDNTLFVNLPDLRLIKGYEVNSMSVDPRFYGEDDLHSNSPDLDGKALYIAGIGKDFDIENRHAQNRDIGADEFILEPFDLAVDQIIPNQLGDSLQIKAVLINLGANPYNDSTITASYSIDNGATWKPSQGFTLRNLNSSNDTMHITFNLKHAIKVKEQQICVRFDATSLPSDAVSFNNQKCKSVCTYTNQNLVVESIGNITTVCKDSLLKLHVPTTINSLYWKSSTDSVNFSPTTNPGADTLHTYPSTKTFFHALVAYPSCGFDTTDVFTVNVLTEYAPAVTLNSLSDTVCSGSKAILGVAGKNPGNTIKWYKSEDGGPLTLIPNETGDSLKHVITKNTSFTAKVVYGTCQKDTSISKSIKIRTIQPITASISANKDTICAGEPVVARILNSPVGSSFQWYKSLDGILYDPILAATSDTVKVSLNESSFIRAKVTYGLCNTDTFFNVRVAVRQELYPNTELLLSDSNICQGEMVKIHLAAPNSLSKQWQFSSDSTNFSNVIGQNSDTLFVVADSFIQYRIELTGSKCNPFIHSDFVSLEVAANPIASFASIDTGSVAKRIELINNSQYSDSFLWNLGYDTIFFSGTDTAVVYNGIGTFTVTLVAQHTFCSSDTFSKSIVVTKNPTSVNNRDVTIPIKIYPNPSSGELNVLCDNCAGKTIQVIDMKGRVVLTKELELNLSTLDLFELPNSVYFLKHEDFKTLIIKQ